MSYYALRPDAFRFLRTLAVDPSFDWMTWASSDEAQHLRNPAALATATTEQLVKLMTWVVRSDRFSEGSFEGAYESGVLRAIIDRCVELAGPGRATMNEDEKLDVLRRVAKGFDQHDLDAIMQHFTN